MKARVTKRQWYKAGGFKNPNCFRKHTGRAWTYWMTID
jgi:hypothetical protein